MKPKALRSKVRVYIPDSHGNHIDLDARNAFLADLKRLDADEIVMLGDHLDCAGTFSSHQRSYTNEMAESYEDDTSATNEFLDKIQQRAPRATIYYLEGNHEQHVERWAAREFQSRKDAEKMLATFGPSAVLELKRRGIRYYKRSETYMNLAIPGTIKLGRIFCTHGIVASKNAAAVHVERFGGTVRFGHIHRRQTFGTRTVASSAIEAACPGTLAKLQPLYMHTNPSGWSHGYGLEFVAASGLFAYFNIPIFDGVSALDALLGWRAAA